MSGVEGGPCSTQHAARSNGSRPSERGVALVVTLILLAIITFMAIAFLFLATGQKSAVTSSTDQAIARLAAESAVARAQAELLAPIMAWTNEFNYDLLVSTNYISGAGFINSGVPYTSPTNVSYAYPNGNPVTGNDFLQNLENLLYNPRPPVYITTNRNQTAPAEFRYYVDLNRNGRYDTNGYLPVISPDPTKPYYSTVDGSLMATPAAGITLSNFFVGDPEWIGVLEYPDRPHGPDNYFVSRYAYLVVPVGKALDLNYIHNYARAAALGVAMNSGDGFTRNMGVGTWEINLAAVLADLNTNLWPASRATASGQPYLYNLNLRQANQGAAFEDAAAFVRYRYGANYAVGGPNPLSRNFFNVYQLFGAQGANAFANDYIDGYTSGPLMTNTMWQLPPSGDSDKPLVTPNSIYGWPGSPNPNHYFTTQDLFDTNKTSVNVQQGLITFSNRLYIAGTNTDSYNRYTFYRLLQVLGTDSAPEPPGKININYCNVSGYSATNFVTWFDPQVKTKLGRPGSEVFFTNAVDALLRKQGYTFGVNAIPVFTNNTFVYTPSVQRLLQLAANILDATTNRTYAGATTYPFLPTVFRPVFGPVVKGSVYITDFKEVTGMTFLQTPRSATWWTQTS